MKFFQNDQWERAIQLPIMGDKKRTCSIEGLEKLFREVICFAAGECRVQNSGIVSTTLSGGVDSSFCLGMIREGWSSAIHTFTVGKDESHPDVVHARQVSEIFETTHHEIIPSVEKIQEVRKILATIWPGINHTNGDVAVYLAYEMISQNGFNACITHDGIDEILGGYWEHQMFDDPKLKLDVFQKLWKSLFSSHLSPLLKKAEFFKVNVFFPYLDFDLVKYLTSLPLDQRTMRGRTKIPLREIAKKYLPSEIIKRKKVGFCSALD